MVKKTIDPDMTGTVAPRVEQTDRGGAQRRRKSAPGKSNGKASDEIALPFEARSARLEEIVTRLESGELSLEESLALYEQGIALVRACTQELDEAEQKVKILRRTIEGEIRPADFSGASDE